MLEPITLFIAGVFVVAGIVNGVIGLGLPTYLLLRPCRFGVRQTARHMNFVG